jgi:hypothetical protein
MATKTPAPAAKTGIKKLNLGGIATKTEKTATEYPQLPASDDLARLVTDYLDEARELESIEGSLEIKKAELKSIAQGFYFEHLHGKLDIPSSVEAKGTKPDQTIIVSFANRYKMLTDETPIIEAIGAERTGQFFRQAFELKVDGDKIPADVAEELIGEIQALFAKHNATEALSAKAVIKPTSDFHVARHSQLSVSENIAVDGICPIVAMVKTKGRRK